MKTQLDISVAEGVECALGADEIQFVCDTVLGAEGVRRPCFVSVSVVDDDRMRGLNNTWRGQDRPTDVLSLECERPDDPELGEDEPCQLGDIVLAPAYIERQAAGFGVTAANETRLLLVHGILHLLGYDHVEEDEAQEMEAREDELLLELGRLLDEDALGSHVSLTRHAEMRP